MARVLFDTYLRLHYAGQGGVATWRTARVRGAYRVDAPSDAYPHRRIILTGTDVDTRKSAQWRADRILQALDAQTGEYWPIRENLINAGFDDSVTTEATPLDAGRFRTTAHGIDFDTDHGGVAGWYFHVPRSFRTGLDLSDTDPPSQGYPPAYAFALGDTFYDHHRARVVRWADAIKWARWMLQVVDAQPDTPDNLEHRTAKVNQGIPNRAWM